MSDLIDRESLATLCICAIRYCHGRRTYMPSLVQRIVRSVLKDIPDEDLQVMIEDCDFQRRFELYGDSCDKVDWLAWRKTLEAEKERRKNE